MGFIWDLIQQSQIDAQKSRFGSQRKRTRSLESRVGALEQELRTTRALVHELLVRLERQLGEDIDGDGSVG